MKSFLMTGKKRNPIEILYHTESTDEADKKDNSRHHSPVSIESIDTTRKCEKTASPTLHGNASAKNADFTLPECSEFHNIHRSEIEALSNIQLTSAMNASALSVQRMVPTPFLFQYSVTSLMNESAPKFVPPISPSYMYQPVSVSGPDNISNIGPELGDKNAYYYVDHRIPFTNYFLNLRKLFSKGCSETSQISRMRDNNPRTDDREETGSVSPEMDGINDLDSERKHEVTNHVSNEKRELNVQTRDLRLPQENGDIELQSHKKFNPKCTVPSFQETHIPQFLDWTLHHPPTMPTFPFPGAMDTAPSLFHPTIHYMRHSLRRVNSEKSPAVKKYKCDVCERAFSRSNTLVTHKRIHTGDKPFKCEVCDRVFRQPGNLTRHRLTHTTVKPYVCLQCNKAFNRVSNLHTHMRTHSNQKPFICLYCGKGFYQKMDMKIHCYTHTGERPHRCHICGKGFSLASTLNTHRRIHTKPVNVQTCNPCK